MSPEDIFKRFHYGLRWLGHNLDRNESMRSRWAANVKHITLLIAAFLAQWCLLSYTVNNIADLTLATASLSISLTNLLTCIKAATFLINKKKLMDMIRKFEVMFREINKVNDTDLMTNGNNTARCLVTPYFFMTSCTGFYFTFTPLIKMILAKMMERPIIREMPMPMLYPFNTTSSPGYELAFLHSAYCVFYVVIYASIIDGLFLTFILNLRSHFQVLEHFLQSNTFQEPEREVEATLKAYIQYHSLLLDMSKSVRDAYRPIVFAQFLITSLQVCAIMYQLVTHMQHFYIFLAHLVYLIAIMLQLFIYCFGGEVLRNESKMVGTAVQLSDWYNLSPKMRQLILLMLQRSQREVAIKAGFYEASLANFMFILKAAVSYITLIQSMERK